MRQLDEQLSELEKLQQAAQLIEEMSQGRLQVCPSVVGQVYIRPQHDSNLGMDMRIDSIPGQPHYVPPDDAHNRYFEVDTALAYLDAFISQVREAYGKLELFGPEHCEPNSYESLDYEGRVLVLSPDTLKESCWTPQNQLWLAHDGFGCSPHAVGRSIRCTCLGDGEQTRWNRTDFTGVLKEEFLPGWAREKLEELQGQNAGMGGMEMT